MNWPAVPIDELVTITGGGTPRRDNDAYFGGDIPWVTPKDMKRWEIADTEISITQEAIDNSAAKLVPSNTVLIVVRSGILKHTFPVAINRCPVAINQDMKSLNCGRQVAPEYLGRFLKFSESQVLSWVRATTADNFPVDKLRELQVPLPPLAEQRRIAAILDQADDLRRKRLEALARIELMPEIVFQQEISNAPTIQLRSVTDEIYRYPTYFNIAYENTGLPEIRGEMLLADGKIAFDGENTRYISKETSFRFPRTILDEGDLVMSVRGTIGKIGLVPDALKGANITANLIRIAPDRTKIEPLFLWQALRSPRTQAALVGASSATTILTIKAPDLKALPIPSIPLEKQRVFANRIAEIDKLKAANRAHLEKLDALFTSLQHRAFRGELTG